MENAPMADKRRDSLESLSRGFSIDPDNLECLSSDRSTWRSCFEDRHIIEPIQKRAQCKARADASSAPALLPAFPCPHCGWTFKAQIGLTSHLRNPVTPWSSLNTMDERHEVSSALCREDWCTTRIYTQNYYHKECTY